MMPNVSDACALTKHILFCRAALFLNFLLFATGAKSEDPLREELVSRIVSQADVIQASLSGDIAISVEESEAFEGEILVSRSGGLRQLIDAENEQFIGALYSREVRSEEPDGAKVSVLALAIDDGVSKTLDTNGGNRWISYEYIGFFETLESRGFPLVSRLAIDEFPFILYGKQQRMELLEDFRSPQNELAVSRDSDTVSFKVTRKDEGGEYVFNWTFGIDSGVLVNRHIDRVARGKMRRVFDCILTWEKRDDGEPLLVMIHSERAIVQVSESPKKLKFGERTSVCDIRHEPLESDSFERTRRALIDIPSIRKFVLDENRDE